MNQQEFDAWATCDCKEFKVCMWSGEGLCYPCTVEKIGKEETDRRYNETRAEDGSWDGPESTLKALENQ